MLIAPGLGVSGPGGALLMGEAIWGMANRLDTIITRGGDQGETSLADGARVAKDDARIALMGDIDELNCWIGLARLEASSPAIGEMLLKVQHDLFDLGGGLSFPGAPLLSSTHVERLEKAAIEANDQLPTLEEFILPGGSRAISYLHMARAVCRRAERALVCLARTTRLAGSALPYLNRLSDYLFIAARTQAKLSGVKENLWIKRYSITAASKPSKRKECD